MRFELFIAARYLRAKRRQAVVGVITLISVIGVAAGVASLIIALAITNGMRRDMQEKLVGSSAHVMLMRVAADGIRDWRPLVARLRGLPHVTAAAPALYEEVLIAHGVRSGGAQIEGVVPEDQRTVSDLLDHVTAGSAEALEPLESVADDPTHRNSAAMNGAQALEPAGSNGLHPTLRDEAAKDGAPEHFSPGQVSAAQAIPPIVIGQDLAESIGALVGDTVMVVSPQGELSPLGMVPKYQKAEVVGIFKSGFYQYDATYAFMRLADAQRLFSEPDLISAINFKVDDMYKAAEVGREIEQAAGPGFQTTNWMEQNRELFRALRLEQVVTFIILALIVCVAALNILIALTMMVMEKTKDIAVLMSFGVSEAQVRRIFLLQGLLISVIGTLVGLVVGYGLSWVGGHYKFIQLDPQVYSIDYLPFAPRLVDAVIVAAVSLGVSLLATIYPSASAAKVLPAEALRYE
jgi:lipoprotein-releasing system permease protein